MAANSWKSGLKLSATVSANWHYAEGNYWEQFGKPVCRKVLGKQLPEKMYASKF